MIKKQLRTILICGGAFLLLLAVFLIFVRPLLAPETTEVKPPELLEGEVLGSNNRILMFRHVEQADILSIEVHNEHGTYTFYRGDDNKFYIKGMEGVPYDLDLFTSLVVSSGYTLTIRRLDDREEDLSAYGLGEDDNPAWYLLTQMDGKTTHKVYIGDMIPTGGGYYCMYDGRDAVYILDPSLGQTLLADVYSLITPSLGYPIPSSAYMSVDDFQIVKDGELFLAIDMIPPSESGKEDGTNDYKMLAPANFSPNLTAYTTVLESLSALTGSEVVACGNDDLDDSVLEQFGLDPDAAYCIAHYKYDDIDTYVSFSKPDEEGTLYAYTTVYHLVAKLNIADVPFLNWGILEFVTSSLFSENINDVSKIEISGKIENGLEEENLEVDAFFTLEGSEQTIQIRPNGAANPYDLDSVRNFRQLYKTILGIRLENYADETDIDKMTPLATLTVELDNGEKTEYRFYTYSTRRCFYTINGKGEFYVLRDSVEKMLRDTDRMLKGLPIDSDAKN